MRTSKTLTFLRVTSCLGFGLLSIILQTIIAPHFPLPGGLLTPIPAAVVLIGIFGGMWLGGTAGFLCGAAWDAASVPGDAVFSVMMAAAGVFSGMLAQRYFSRNFLTSLIFTAAAALVAQLFYGFCFFWLPQKVNAAALWQVVLPGVGWSLVCLPVLYVLFAPARRQFGRM